MSRPAGRRQPQISERDLAIVRLREEGETLHQIGRRFGISRERVRQILLGLDAIDSARAATQRARRQVFDAEARRVEVLGAWRQGGKPSAIAARLGIPQKSVMSVIAVHATGADRATRRLVQALGRRGNRGSSDGQLIETIKRVAADTGRSPTGPEYGRIATAQGLPSLSTVAHRFGGWDAALRAAGLPPTRRSRTDQVPRWDEERCLEALGELRAQHGALPTTREYERLSRARSDLPSCATLRKRFGSWSHVALLLADEAIGLEVQNAARAARAPSPPAVASGAGG